MADLELDQWQQDILDKSLRPTRRAEAELTGCRARRCYSVGIMSILDRRFAHKCNFHGKDRPRLIRWSVEGPARPVEIPEWCPLKQKESTDG